jgi:hypothetical protein
MGGAGVGVCDDGAAWYQNPAGLGALNVGPCQKGQEWANDAIGSFGKAFDDNDWGITWSGWEPSKQMGFGAGYGKIDGSHSNSGDAYGAGFGMALGSSPFSAGINIERLNPEESSDPTTFGIGVLYKWSQQGKPAPVRIGLTCNDVTNQTYNGRTFNVGVAYPVTTDLLVAVDWNSFNDSDNRMFDFGGEYALGQSHEWRIRAGDLDTGSDHVLTLGAGYAFKSPWRLDAAWADTSNGNTWQVGVGVGF